VASFTPRSLYLWYLMNRMLDEQQRLPVLEGEEKKI
jgi:hypothetical protein